MKNSLIYFQYNKTNAALFVRNPFILKNEEWKENRADISPAFTTLKVFITVLCEMFRKTTIKFISDQIDVSCYRNNVFQTNKIY